MIEDVLSTIEIEEEKNGEGEKVREENETKENCEKRDDPQLSTTSVNAVTDGENEVMERMRRQEKLLITSLENEGRRNEWIDWDEKIKIYEKEKIEEERKVEKQIEERNKKKHSMELMHLCINTLREESNDWRDGQEKRSQELEKKERFSTIMRKKELIKENNLQKKLMQTWLRLPAKDRDKYREEEKKKLRLDLANTKRNLHRWRSREGEVLKEKMGKGSKKNETTTEEKIEDLEKILDRLRDEKRLEDERLKREIEDRRLIKERMRTEREKREEERRRSKERRRAHLEKHRRIQEAWRTLRWITAYIEENEEIWEIERLEREVEMRKIEDEWNKSKRFEKIAFLRERERKIRNGEQLVENKDSQENQSWYWTEWRMTKEHILPEENLPKTVEISLSLKPIGKIGC